MPQTKPIKPSFQMFQVEQNGARENIIQEADFTEILTIIGRRYKAVLLGIMICLVPAALYILSAPKLYSAATSILVDPRQNRGIGAEMTAANLFSDVGQIESQIKLISSQAVLKRVVESEKLLNDPEFGVSPPGFMSRIFSVMSGTVPQSSKNNDIVGSVEALSKAVSVKRPERTYVIEIQVSSLIAEKSARLANAIAKAYMDDSMDARNLAVNFETEWVRDRLADIQDKLKSAEARTEDYKLKNKFFDASGKSVNDEQINALSAEIITARSKSADAKAKYQQIQNLMHNGKGLDSLVDALKSGSIEKLRTQAADIARQEASLRTTLGPRHPQYLEIQQQAADTRSLINIELKRIATATASDAQATKQAEVTLEKELERLRSISDTNNQTKPKLRELEREAEAQRAAYEKFTKIRDTLQQQGADAPVARVIAPASTPDFAYSPRKAPILALALASGLGLGLAQALMRESFVRRRRSRITEKVSSANTTGAKTISWKFWQPKTTDALAKMPFAEAVKAQALAKIPAFRQMYSAQAMRFAIDDKDSSYYQSVAKLCSFIMNNRNLDENISKGPVFIVLTSLELNTGKTVLCSNLGIIAAQAGIRTFLIDADPSNANLSFYGVDYGIPGLIPIMGSLKLVFKAKNNLPLYILPASETGANENGEAISSQPKKLLPQFLNGDIDHNFDLVIVDGGLIDANAIPKQYAGKIEQVFLIETNFNVEKASMNKVAEALNVTSKSVYLVHVESRHSIQAA